MLVWLHWRKILNLLEKVIGKLGAAFLTVVNSIEFNRVIKNRFSSNLIDLLVYSYWLKLSETDHFLVEKIERLRYRTRNAFLNENVVTYTSPKSGEPLFEENGAVKVGEKNYSAKGSFAKTGTGPKTGIQLKKVTEAFFAKDIIELGTNTGLSGCYFLSAKHQPHLTTVEGSEQLCSIAEKNLSEVSKNFEVINGMFDLILDQLILANRKFDLAFIDGQHEEKATIHYSNKLKKLLHPNGIIVFDDIFWSEGMHRAWEHIKGDADFDMIIGLRTRGIARFSTLSEKSIFEMTYYTGQQEYYRKGH